ncbi:MAG: hypothetical protein LBL59_04655 [Xanthomonadaceae bacterium]|nr:hypothetical protein [Xanthomonadaceae bacterium]
MQQPALRIAHVDRDLDPAAHAPGHHAEILELLQQAIQVLVLIGLFLITACPRGYAATRKRPCTFRPGMTVARVVNAPGWFLDLRIANSRLALRQLATAATTAHEGLGPVPVPTGGISSVSNPGIVVSSNRIRNT